MEKSTLKGELRYYCCDFINRGYNFLVLYNSLNDFLQKSDEFLQIPLKN